MLHVPTTRTVLHVEIARLILRVEIARLILNIGGGALTTKHWVTGDTTPITFTIRDDAETVVNLTGYSGKFFARRRGASANKVNGTAITITTAASGECEYRWLAADVNQAGIFDCEIELTDGAGYVVTTEARAAFTLDVRSGLG